MTNIKSGIFLLLIVLASCVSKTKNNNATVRSVIPITGTWKLITGTLIEKSDTVVTSYTTDKSFIKIINDTHFAFLQHDLNKGKDSSAVFGAGGGSYTLKDSTYTEHLEYCTARNWEGNDFTFTVTVRNDTLVQQGIEKIESENVNRINIEKYVRIK